MDGTNIRPFFLSSKLDAISISGNNSLTSIFSEDSSSNTMNSKKKYLSDI